MPEGICFRSGAIHECRIVFGFEAAAKWMQLFPVCTGARRRLQLVGGDGWESNPPRTPHQRPANGFEDRGPAVHNCPHAGAAVRTKESVVRDGPPSSIEIHRLGCHLCCHWTREAPGKRRGGWERIGSSGT